MKLPKRLKTNGRAYLPKPQRRAIVLDTIRASDLRNLELRFFCDDCAHFNHEMRTCTIGYRARHTRTEQLRLYDLTGKMALCRSIEID